MEILKKKCIYEESYSVMKVALKMKFYLMSALEMTVGIVEKFI